MLHRSLASRSSLALGLELVGSTAAPCRSDAARGCSRFAHERTRTARTARYFPRVPMALLSHFSSEQQSADALRITSSSEAPPRALAHAARPRPRPRRRWWYLRVTRSASRLCSPAPIPTPGTRSSSTIHSSRSGPTPTSSAWCSRFRSRSSRRSSGSSHVCSRRSLGEPARVTLVRLERTRLEVPRSSRRGVTLPFP